MSDLLVLAERARESDAARWEFARHPAIARFVAETARRYGKDRHEAEDLVQDLTLRVAEVFGPGLAFVSEPQLLAYWRRRIGGLVESALAASGAGVFHRKRFRRRLFQADQVRLEEDLETPPETLDHTEQLVRVKKFLADYPCEIAARCFWYRVQGAPWNDIPELAGLPGGPAGRERARRLYQRVAADAKAHFLERGGSVPISILGIYADEQEVGAVLLSGRVVLAHWEDEWEDDRDLEAIEGGIEGLFDRGAHQVAANELPPCELGALVRSVCLRRQIPFEEFDLEVLQAAAPPPASKDLRLGRAGRRAYLLARAKRAENELKAERY